MGCVYLIKHRGMAPIKIGYTDKPTPNRRITEAQVYSPHPIEIVGWFECENPQLIEYELHKKYDSFRLSGEWFNISMEQAKAIINSYDSTFEDRAQRALLKEETEYNLSIARSGTDVIIEKFSGREMLRSTFYKELSSYLSLKYGDVQKWVNTNLVDNPLFTEYKENKTGRGRPGWVVRIGEEV